MTTRHDLTHAICPTCHKLLDGATTIEPDEMRQPDVGDLSICIYCGELLEFIDGLRLSKLTKEQLSAMPLETVVELVYVQTKVRQFQGSRHN